MTSVTFVRALRHLAIVEGISTLILFGIAMPLKYFAGMPLAVRIVGSLHGALFVALVVMLLLAIRKVPISLGLAAAGIAAAVVPGGPFLLDRHLAPFDAQRGSLLASSRPMDNDKSTEEQNVKIDAIVGDEALGYDGSGRGEHSGQEDSGATQKDDLGDELADNRPDQLK